MYLKYSKKNKAFWFVSLCFFFIGTLCFQSAYGTPVLEESNKTILLDPGHGGVDGGGVSRSGALEKDINLSISMKTKEQLSKAGFTAIMTREHDKGLYTDDGTIRKKKIEDLNNRCNMKRESNCDLFISIHQNLFPESKYKGAQVWYADNDESRKLAAILQKNLREGLDPENNRVQKPAGNAYKILRCETMPSVIIECGFLSNAEEESKLKSEDYQNKIAEVITKSVKEYYMAS